MASFKGRSDNKGLAIVPSTDLLVCFPSRAHLTLMPKPICSPARPTEPNKRHHLKKINTRPSGLVSSGPGQASPLFWSKNKQMGSNDVGRDISEPTSPKVTCAGQIKVRPRGSTTCRNWQSVMEEVEKIHNRSKTKKKSNWAGPLGFKKDVMNFLTCLRSIRFDLRCFGSFPEPVVTSEDEDEDEEDDGENYKEMDDEIIDDKSSTVFSKWFMVLQENNQQDKTNNEIENDENDPAIPPPNALLLMRCRSAPAKSWLEERERRAKERESEKEDDQVEVEKEEKKTMVIKKQRRKSLEIVMKYDTDFYKSSPEMDEEDQVVQETWIVGDLKDVLSRSRSWKR